MDDGRARASGGRGSPSERVEGFGELAARIAALPPSCGRTRLIGVDGPGGAGKSTFAARLATAAGGATVVHTDDFASWDNQFDWADRLLAQVVSPLRAGRVGRYRRYDWVDRAFAEWHEVAPATVVIAEGVGGCRRELAGDLALAVWVQTPADLRLARGIARDGEQTRAFWDQWIVGEAAHFAADRPRDRADLVVDGNPSVPHDPEREFVVLAGPGWA